MNSTLIILDRLHRGDSPHMVPVTAAQSDGRRLVIHKQRRLLHDVRRGQEA